MEPEDLNDDGVTVPGLELKGGPSAWREYAGKIVAVAGGEVRAFGATWGECLAAVKSAGLAVESVELVAVPGGVLIG